MNKEIEALLAQIEASSGEHAHAGDRKHANLLARAAALIRELEQDRERMDWIVENSKEVGGGNGGTVTFVVTFDSECLRTAIDRTKTSRAEHLVMHGSDLDYMLGKD